jgi:hypothetical protein
MDDAASAASLNLDDQEYIEMMKNVAIWFHEFKDVLAVEEDYSDISTERSLSEGDDGFHYRGE